MQKEIIEDSVGIVVIGRNEGDRLRTSLASVNQFGYPVAYVDSGSTDDSVNVAKNYATLVHELDRSSPFSAARARNEGFDVITSTYPGLKYVQFVDGDCVVAPGWFEAGVNALSVDGGPSLVLGHRKELKPDFTIYNRLAAIEWNSPVGELTNFGCLIGSFLVKVPVFKAMNGFKTNVIAGEDSELGVRMCLAGHKMHKIDYHMETHDANILKFSQWWNRAVRAGHAVGQRAHINGDTAVQDCVKERKSTIVWGIVMPIVAIIMLFIFPLVSLAILGLYGVMFVKVYRYAKQQGMTHDDALIYTSSIVVGKVANGIGFLKFQMNAMKKQYVLIEYK